MLGSTWTCDNCWEIMQRYDASLRILMELLARTSSSFAHQGQEVTTHIVGVLLHDILSCWYIRPSYAGVLGLCCPSGERGDEVWKPKLVGLRSPAGCHQYCTGMLFTLVSRQPQFLVTPHAAGSGIFCILFQECDHTMGQWALVQLQQQPLTPHQAHASLQGQGPICSSWNDGGCIYLGTCNLSVHSRAFRHVTRL